MINYDLSQIKACIFDIDGVLSRDTVALDDEGIPRRTVNIKDGYVIQLAVKCGLHLAIITGAQIPFLRVRYERLGVQDICIGAAVKKREYALYLEKYGWKANEVLYMGDDIPDYEVMQLCGLPCCPADACPEIKSISCYISPYNGGEGCVRDVLEQILKVQGKWMSHAEAFGW